MLKAGYEKCKFGADFGGRRRYIKVILPLHFH
jgi:hypothetical protein